MISCALLLWLFTGNVVIFPWFAGWAQPPALVGCCGYYWKVGVHVSDSLLTFADGKEGEQGRKWVLKVTPAVRRWCEEQSCTEWVLGRVFCSQLQSGAALNWCWLLLKSHKQFMSLYTILLIFPFKKCWTEVVAKVQSQSYLKNTQRAGKGWSWGCSLMLPKQGAVGNDLVNVSVAIRTAAAFSIQKWAKPWYF